MNSLVMYENNPFDLMERFFNDDEWLMPGFRTPEIDVYEEGDKYMLEADLPGLNEKDIKLEVRNGQLTFSTLKNEKSEEKSKKDRWIRKERREFQFVRSFTLPEDVDANGIEAHFKNGVLQVVMPKKPEAAPKTIEVKIA
ncbi:MAG: Hsp20/alpha crystallin family protein [Rectinema sp.]|jgi:HSP20 family protein|uniref:Heat shock protein Hsp20 n=1 Tax=uncultured spirochete TaxID=156406 RepID=A0A3P3XNW5_9SPIR|nr:Heat shock protein Hsp20 [uncultured spirochete]